MANIPPIRAGHGNWVSPNFWRKYHQHGIGWINRLRKKRLPAKKIAREVLRAYRKTMLGVNANAATNSLFAQIENDDENAVWSGSRALGRGTFGVATLYTGHDPSTGEQVDSLVLKEGALQAVVDRFVRAPGEDRVEGLAKDAAILADLNKQDPTNRTNFLRRFAYNKLAETQRYYLEHCAMDLERMKFRYGMCDKYL